MKNLISKYHNILISLFGIILVDQITKAILSSRDFYIWKMHFHLVKNFGLSFGLNFGNTVNFVIILVALILFVIYIPKNLSSKKVRFGIALVSAGAISNLVDRILFGFVRDFWDINLGFTFNFADLFIVVGIILLFTDNPIASDKGNQERVVG